MANERTKPIPAPRIAETRGGTPLYNDPAAFQSAVLAYFDECEEAGCFPDEAGMFVALKIFEEDLQRLYEKEDGWKYERVMKVAKLRRESWLARNMVADNKLTNGCMNALKQERNGGYNDRPKASEQKRVVVVFEGVEGGTELFG